jgi:two-component system nitrogen regulation response regulator GlnG
MGSIFGGKRFVMEHESHTMESKHARVLIVDDEPNIHYSFQKIFGSEMEILSAHSAEDGINLLRSKTPEAVVMDIKLPGIDGLEALQKIRQIDAHIPIVIMTAFGTVDTAIEAMKYGAFEYILKPFDVDKMREVLRKAIAAGESQHKSPSDRIPIGDPKGSMLVGASPAMQEVYKLIGRVAAQNVTVLILGESGTGKEMAARAIYHHSARADKPFLEVNCAALPESLLESELFGHEKGAFTGAYERHIGKFEQVTGGTMFLDEIGEMSLLTQAKILRVIQYGEFTRVGGKQVIRTDVRLLIATNRNLEQMIRDGKFREDLYYRLNIISVHLPTLGEREGDIPDLVNHFLARYSREVGKKLQGIEKRAMRRLNEYHWPGNVRQLENCIRRAVVLAKGSTVTVDDLELDEAIASEVADIEQDDDAALNRILQNIIEGKNRTKLWPAVEEKLIRLALQKSGGNQTEAARILGIHRNTLRNRMERYRIQQ